MDSLLDMIADESASCVTVNSHNIMGGPTMAANTKTPDADIMTMSANRRAQRARYEATQELTDKHKAEFDKIHQTYKDKYGIKDRETRTSELRRAKAEKALAALDPETRKALLASLK